MRFRVGPAIESTAPSLGMSFGIISAGVPRRIPRSSSGSYEEPLGKAVMACAVHFRVTEGTPTFGCGSDDAVSLQIGTLILGCC